MFSQLFAALLSIILFQAPQKAMSTQPTSTQTSDSPTNTTTSTSPTVAWTVAVNQLEGNDYELVLEGKVAEGYYVHPMGTKYSGTTLTLESTEEVELMGATEETYEPAEYKGEKVVCGDYVLRQRLQAAKATAINGSVSWSACSGDECGQREDFDFTETIAASGDQAGAAHQSKGGLWGLILEAILWGFLMLLTPCVFPMVPMTVSFFLKQSPSAAPTAPSVVPAASTAAAPTAPSVVPAASTAAAPTAPSVVPAASTAATPTAPSVVPAASTAATPSPSSAKGRFNALAYGLFIVLLYTLPICIIIGITWAAGGSAVTADIFNWLSTHWLPNILFFVIFMLFAASFFGAFELTLPSKWTTKADAASTKSGLAGVFFLALTLVLVSFSCTGPIVGTVLIKSTQGEFWTPMVTMLAFSVAFALPFALLAFFPSILTRLPRSGGWLNSVKVSLGFIELALGLKFLSVADQTYHWHLLDREVYLAIWIVIFALLGLYLLGKIRFKYDSPLEYISVGRLALVIADFAFVVYMIPGMWGAPLKALSGYLPPMETQDFVMAQFGPMAKAGSPGTAPWPHAADGPEAAPWPSAVHGTTISLPHGLRGYDNIEDGLAAAGEEGKKVFVDITGHGCVNCREMEARVWSDPQVRQRLKENYVIVALYVDDKTRLPEEKWVTLPSGKVLKDVGRVNSHIASERLGANSQPTYYILDEKGTVLDGPYSYNLDVDSFVRFLD